MSDKRFFSAVKGFREHIADHTGRLYSDNEVANLLNTVYGENEQLKKDIEYYKTERLALFEYLNKKDDLKLELKVKK